MIRANLILAAIFSGIILLPSISLSQDTIPEDFYFEAQWGIYGHFKVSSKEEKVSQIVNFDYYGHNPISFTKEEKLLIWNKISLIDFYDYPDTIPGCSWRLENESDNIEEYEYEIDEESEFEKVDISNVFISIYLCKERAIPYSKYSLTVYNKNKQKKIEWECGYTVYTDSEYKDFVINHKIKKLFDILYTITDIVEEKEAYKTLPKTRVMYY